MAAGQHRTLAGGCHCGAVRFTVKVTDGARVQTCNCSICAKCAYLHLIVPDGAFRILRGEEALATYTFNTGTARHRFCRHCGVKAFYVPRSNPDGWSVNARCLPDDFTASVSVEAFNGRNWEQHGPGLAGLTGPAA